MKVGRQSFASTMLGCSAAYRDIDIDTLRFYSWAKSVPVSDCRNENDALAIRERRGGEPTDRAVEKLLILVKLDNVVSG